MSNKLEFIIGDNGKATLQPISNQDSNTEDTAKFLKVLESSNCVGKGCIKKKCRKCQASPYLDPRRN